MAYQWALEQSKRDAQNARHPQNVIETEDDKQMRLAMEASANTKSPWDVSVEPMLPD